MEINLDKFTVLIGANASGKSNFIQIFKFLRDIVNYGLDNAVSMQGGIEYLKNISVGPSQNLSLEIVYDQGMGTILSREEKLIGVEIYEVIYTLVIRFSGEEPQFEIVEDRIIEKFDVTLLKKQGKKIEKEEKLGQGEIILSNVKGKVLIDLNLPEGVKIEKKIYSLRFWGNNYRQILSFLEALFLSPRQLIVFSEKFQSMILILRYPKKLSQLVGKLN